MKALIYLALLLPSLAAANPIPMHAPTPDEFAMRLPLAVSGDNGVVQLQLPLLVYQNSRSADLADLRVYNSAGQTLPYALHRPSYRTRIQSRESGTALFPIYQNPQRNGAPRDLQLELRTDRDGSLLSIQTREEVSADSSPLSTVIIDLGPSARNEVLESLRFELPASTRDYRARVAIERSEDLRLWDGAAYGSLDWISAADDSRQLVNDRINLPIGTGRYLKLRWTEGEAIGFAAIHARWRGASVVVDPTLEVELTARPGRIEGDFSYSASPAIAATALGLLLPEANTVLPVSIGVYREQPQRKPQWRLQAQIDSTFYRLTKDGRERVSGRINIAPMAASEWILRPHASGHAAPRLVLEWQPQTLVFNAQGSGFYLAVGAAPEAYRRWLGGPSPLDRVAPGYSRGEIEQLEHAVVGAAIGPAPVQQPTVEAVDDDGDAARQRRFVLWSVLGLGILVLGFMSWRLYGQLNAADSDNRRSGGDNPN